MTQLTLDPVMTHDTTESAATGIYKIGGAAVLIAFLVALLDTCLSFVPAAVTPDPGKGSAVDWFALLHQDWFLGVRGLGLLNIIGSFLMLGVFTALYTAIDQAGDRRQSNRIYAALAVLLLGVGATIYTANNPALSMLHLSGQYHAAAGEMERALLTSSAQALLARAEDFTPGAFPGFFFNEAAGILMGWVLLRSRLFTQLTVWSGISGFTCLLVFTIWATFVPEYYDMAMMVAMAGGVASMAWYILVARRLFQLGRGCAQAQVGG